MPAKNKTSDYWKERFRLLEEAQNRVGRECYEDIERHYRGALKEIEGKVAVWYQRFAENNSVSMAKARRMLDRKELEELKWDVREYIRYGQENAVSGEWIKELENASARFHISRLEALKLQIRQSVEALYGRQTEQIEAAMRRIYQSGYYHTAYEIQKGCGVGWDFFTLNDRLIDRVIHKPWAADGKNFSERIWENRRKLVNELNTVLTRNMILGQDPQTAIDAIAKKMGVSKNVAGRLVMTEEAFFSSDAQKAAFDELGVEKYEIVATLDSKTSEICQEMDGKTFSMSQWEVGVTAPPFHVRCRTTTVPYDEDFGDTGKRAARGKDGKTYYVPSDMKYKDWKKSFVDGDTSGLKEKKTDGTINPADITDGWTKTEGIKGTVTEKQEYIVNGATYKVDGKHVILHPTEHERGIAATLSEKYGKSVAFVPQVMLPQGIQTPDFMIDGERFDLKAPTGRGKNLLYGMLAKKRRQSPNFIFDITGCPLSEEGIIRQVEGIYASRHTRFVEKIVIIKDGKILRVFDRK